MNELEKFSTEELLKELEEQEEKYVKNLASKFDRSELNKIWERIKNLKEELAKRENKDNAGT